MEVEWGLLNKNKMEIDFLLYGAEEEEKEVEGEVEKQEVEVVVEEQVGDTRMEKKVLWKCQ